MLANLAMEPPANVDGESQRDEKVKVLRSIPPIEQENLVRGRFRGFLEEPGVAKDSKTETFAALKLDVDSWRWQGVPFYIRAGKSLPVTCTEVLVRLRRPPKLFPAALTEQNHFRFRINPDNTMALGVTAMDDDDKSIGQRAEQLQRRARALPAPQSVRAATVPWFGASSVNYRADAPIGALRSETHSPWK